MVTEFHYNPELFWAKVDKSGECWLWTASVASNGYGQVKVEFNGRRAPVAPHRISYQEFNGEVPEGMHIDHMCHNKLCVKPDHLRMVTRKQNGENRRGLPVNNTSGALGVSWAARQGKWLVKIKHNNKFIYGGYFHNLEEAKAKALDLRLEHFTHNDLDRTAA